MSFLDNLPPIATVLSGITAGIILVSDDRRLRIGMLAIQYLCVTSLISISVPLKIAIIKLVAGWASCLILGLTTAQKGWLKTGSTYSGLPRGWLFRMIAALLVSTSAIGMGSISLLDFPGIQSLSVASTLLLIGLGILQISLSERPLRIGIGLLTILSGFEILYNALEPALAVMALMASIHIGIALVISILEVDVIKQEKPEVEL
jgi:hypothetical protein